MTRDQIFSIISERLGTRADLIPRMATEVQLLQETVLETHEWLPWFLETELVEVTSATVLPYVNLPEDFLREREEQTVWKYKVSADKPYIPLEKLGIERLIAKYPGVGEPKGYALGVTKIILAPAPVDPVTIYMQYFAKDVALSTDITNLWLTYASDVVIGELGVIMAEKHMQHSELGQLFRADAKIAWDRLYRVTVARAENSQDRIMEN